jgi:Glycosyl hydrolases family 2, TIM barrel domain/Glycosyl hydrolases family 2, sugar binding domain/Glycosyl hydrolases family 2
MSGASSQLSAPRNCLSLDGPWSFRHEADGNWRTANVPGPWQAEFADLRHKSGRAVYKRTFSVPTDWKASEIAVKFGAVSYFCEVRLNGQKIVSHEGGYLPFECVAPEELLRPENLLEVDVLLPDGNPQTAPDFPFAEIPHGKQSWYGPLGGIWQSVTLEGRDPVHVKHCGIQTDRVTGKVTLKLELSAAKSGVEAHIHVSGPDGAPAASVSRSAEGQDVLVEFGVPQAKAWSPDAPNLYSARIELRKGQVTLDCSDHVFGFRSIETRDGKFFLNGEPLYLRGALDQDYYPEGICTPPSVEFLEDQIRKAKALGLNLLRCHIKVPDPRYYEAADRLGMLIWTEIPNVATFTENSARRMRGTMEGIVRRDGNHPSIIIWTIINEDWGTRTIEDASHRKWLAETYDWLKALDPSRLVVDNSACHTNFHVKTDINDYHYYRSVPERRAEWDKLTEEFASGADWTFSQHGDGERRGDEPLVVSEFGVWGLPDPKKLLNADGSEPWWMETGPGWGDGAAYPHSIQNRFAVYQLDSVFGSFDQFINAVQWYQFSNLKYEIESMRARASIMGYVVTELTDVHWEANGLMDLNRNPRVFHERFAEVNSEIVIVPKVKRYSGVSGENFSFEIAIASGGQEIPDGTELLIEEAGALCGKRTVVQTAHDRYVTEAGAFEVTLPLVTESRMEKFSMKLTASGKELARNEFEIALYPARTDADRPKVATADPVLAKYAAGLGYQVVPASDADVHLAHGLDAADIAALQSGARYTVFADGSTKTHGNLRTDAPPREQPFMPIVDSVAGNIAGPETQLPNIALIARQGTMWRGDWIASFSWIRRDGAFASIPGGPMFELSFDRIVPRHVMTGFRAWEFGGPVHAGLVVGWVHKPAATIAERRVGRGGLVASTFRLMEDPPGDDPVAAAIFDALINTALAMAIEPNTGGSVVAMAEYIGKSDTYLKVC